MYHHCEVNYMHYAMDTKSPGIAVQHFWLLNSTSVWLQTYCWLCAVRKLNGTNRWAACQSPLNSKLLPLLSIWWFLSLLKLCQSYVTKPRAKQKQLLRSVEGFWDNWWKLNISAAQRVGVGRSKARQQQVHQIILHPSPLLKTSLTGYFWRWLTPN